MYYSTSWVKVNRETYTIIDKKEESKSEVFFLYDFMFWLKPMYNITFLTHNRIALNYKSMLKMKIFRWCT